MARADIRNDGRPIPLKHRSARGELPRNSGNFTRGSQLLNTQVLMWLQSAKLPFFMWLGLFAIAYFVILSLTLIRNGTIGSPSPASQPWLAPRKPCHSVLIAAAETMPARLADWSYSVSTGPW